MIDPAPPVPPPVPAPQGGDPLTAQHYAALNDARARRAKLDRAAAVATFNGWSIGVIAALSAPFALFSLTALVMAAGLGAVAYHEFRGRSMLRRLDLRGPRRLGMNQLALAALIVGYSLWCLYAALTGPNPYEQYIQAEPALGETLGSISALYRLAAIGVYGAVIMLTLPYQGLMAWYYFSRGRHLRLYVEQTPAWVMRVSHP